jgi:hypothetical protein
MALKVTVHEDKVRRELESRGPRNRDSSKLCASEVDVLIAKLHGDVGDAICQRSGKGRQSVSTLLGRVRAALGVRGDVELAYLAYERAWIVVEEIGL